MLVVVPLAVLVGDVARAAEHDHEPACGSSCRTRAFALIRPLLLRPQVVMRGSPERSSDINPPHENPFDRDLRRVEALVVRAARLAVLGDRPGDVGEQRLPIPMSEPAQASGAARRAVRDDEVSVRGDLAHRRRVRLSVLRAAALSPDEDRILLGAPEVRGPEDGASLDPGVGVRLDDHLVRSGARSGPARAFDAVQVPDCSRPSRCRPCRFARSRSHPGRRRPRLPCHSAPAAGASVTGRDAAAAAPGACRRHASAARRRPPVPALPLPPPPARNRPCRARIPPVPEVPPVSPSHRYRRSEPPVPDRPPVAPPPVPPDPEPALTAAGVPPETAGPSVLLPPPRRRNIPKTAMD